MNNSEILDIVDGYTPDYTKTKPVEIVDTSRWSVFKECIVRHKSGKYYRITYEEPATEYQDIPIEDRLVTMSEVKPVHKMIIDYVSVNEDEKSS